MHMTLTFRQRSNLPRWCALAALFSCVLLTGAAVAAPQADEAAKAQAQKQVDKEAAKKAKAEAKARKAEEKQAKKAKSANPPQANIADTPKGTYLPGQFTEQERKAAPAQEVKQF